MAEGRVNRRVEIPDGSEGPGVGCMMTTFPKVEPSHLCFCALSNNVGGDRIVRSGFLQKKALKGNRGLRTLQPFRARWCELAVVIHRGVDRQLGGWGIMYFARTSPGNPPQSKDSSGPYCSVGDPCPKTTSGSPSNVREMGTLFTPSPPSP